MLNERTMSIVCRQVLDWWWRGRLLSADQRSTISADMHLLKVYPWDVHDSVEWRAIGRRTANPAVSGKLPKTRMKMMMYGTPLTSRGHIAPVILREVIVAASDLFPQLHILPTRAEGRVSHQARNESVVSS